MDVKAQVKVKDKVNIKVKIVKIRKRKKVTNGQKLLKNGKNCQNGQKWPKKVKNGQTGSKMVKNGKNGQIGQKLSILINFSVWVTRPERPNGAKDEVKQARRSVWGPSVGPSGGLAGRPFNRQPG